MKRRIKVEDYKYLMGTNTKRFLLREGLKRGVISAKELFSLANKNFITMKIEPYVWKNIVDRWRGKEVKDLTINPKKEEKKQKKLLRIKKEQELKKDMEKKVIDIEKHLKHLKKDPDIREKGGKAA